MSQNPGSTPFYLLHCFVYSELWVYFHEQMHMIWHDFHLYDIDAEFTTNSVYEFLQAYIDTIDQDLSAVFWTPDYMIFARVYHIIVALIVHENIIPSQSI